LKCLAAAPVRDQGGQGGTVRAAVERYQTSRGVVLSFLPMCGWVVDRFAGETVSPRMPKRLRHHGHIQSLDTVIRPQAPAIVDLCLLR
jgi:hypothetical protein